MQVGPFSLFVQVVDSKSFSKAAENLYLSPVAVMKRINAFEKDIGVKLLNRTSRGVTPTDAGKVIYNAGHDILQIVETASLCAREVSEKARPTIRIGSSRLNPHGMLREKLAACDTLQMPVSIEVVPFYEDELDLPTKMDMIGRKFDCLFAPYDEMRWGDRFSFYHIKTFPLQISMPASHPLAAKQCLSLTDLHGEKLMFAARGLLSCFDRLRDKLEAEHPEINLADVQIYNTGALNQCLRDNCLLLSFDSWANFHPGLIMRPVEWDAELQMGLVYLKKPTEEMQAFIDYLK